MEVQHCVKCGRGLRAPQGINTTGDTAIAIYITVVTVGLRPRQRSRLKRSVFCVPCAVSISMGPAPDGAFNLTIYEALNELNEQSDSLIQAGREAKIRPSATLKLMPGSKDPSLNAPMLKSAMLSAG